MPDWLPRKFCKRNGEQKFLLISRARFGHYPLLPPISIILIFWEEQILSSGFLLYHPAEMEWSPKSATKAFLDTLKLCNDQDKENDTQKTQKPESSEFLSALAAGMSAKLIVEITSEVSPSTIALAAAARQTGGRLVCILPEATLEQSEQVIKETGLNDIVEFKTEDPAEVLSNFEDIDFSLVDCKTDDYIRVLRLLDVNPRRSVVVANNLVGGRKGLGGHVRGMKDKVSVRSLNHPIGKGMEITMIGKSCDLQKRDPSVRGHYRGERRGNSMRRHSKSKWVMKVDEESGEEHIFRVPKSL